MKKIRLHIFVLVAFSMVGTIALADRGGFGRKDKKKMVNTVNSSSFRNSILSNLHAGFLYKGSILISQQKSNSAIINNTILSYKRGNTTYILPYKHKVIVPEYNRSTGYKLVFRSK